jgi:pre-mRNA-processing factor 6
MTLLFVVSLILSMLEGLQECPTSGILLSLSIWAEPRPARKARGVDALRKAKDDALVVCNVARVFWAEGKVEKAREWFKRAIKIKGKDRDGNETKEGDNGDCWAWWLKFERQYGTLVSFWLVPAV